MDESKYGSRKLLVTSLVMVFMVLIPILYKHIGISDEITLMVEGALATAGSVYNAMNVMQKKYEADDAPKS